LSKINTKSKKSDSRQDTRMALIQSGIDLFGEYGLDGTSTRMLSQSSGANVALISYYFGSKEGLYEACMDYIASQIQIYVKDTYSQYGDIIKSDKPTRTEAKQVIDSIIQTMLKMFLTEEEPKRWNLIISREQSSPTAAFDIIYDGMIKRIQFDLTKMIAIYIGQNPSSEESKIIGHIFISQVLGFITSRESFMRHMETDKLSKKQINTISKIVQNYADSALNGLKEKGVL